MAEHRRKRGRGQGLVEFALVFPLLLMVLVGIAEFGRIFAIYSNLFNAAREGTRYGVVNPRDLSGIFGAARGKIVIIDPAKVTLAVQFDSGPGTPNKSSTTALVGDRVVVTLHYDVEPIIPLLAPLLKNLYVETVAARTISSLGTGFPSSPLPAPTATATETPDPGATATPTATPTPTPTPVPIHIDSPLVAGDPVVYGDAESNQTVYMRDVQDGSLGILTESVDPNGWFTFTLPAGRTLIGGHVIVVEGYGRLDWELVQYSVTPTPTPTPTPMPPYIALSPTCGDAGDYVIQVTGSDWLAWSSQNDTVIIMHEFGVQQTQVGLVVYNGQPSFVANVTVAGMVTGTHTIKAYYEQNPSLGSDSATFEVPCYVPPTPTPTATPVPADLSVGSFQLTNTQPISTYQSLSFDVSVANVGQGPTEGLFWVDLYVDPPDPFSWNSKPSTSSDWTAVSSLDAGASITLTLTHQEGVTATGVHTAYVIVDTLDAITETIPWNNNVGGPLPFTVSVTGTLPVPTPTPTPAPNVGSISGSTFLWVNGSLEPQGRILVECYNGGELLGQTLSALDGTYSLTNIPAGVNYTMVAEAVIDSTLYLGTVPGVAVAAGLETPNVVLLLDALTTPPSPTPTPTP
jgi:Flp pilus assembly protein TadG